MFFNKKRKKPSYTYNYGQSPILNKRREGRNLLTHKTKPSKLPKFLITFSIIIILPLSGYFFLISDYFKVKQIIVDTPNFENEQLSEKIKKQLKPTIGKNLIFIDEKKLSLNLLKTFSELEKIEISKDYPDLIKLNFTQYPTVANVINESSSIKKSYIINKIGYIVKEDFENPTLPYIRIKSEEPINPENVVIEKNTLSYILDSINYFKDKFGMNVLETTYKPIPRELHILTERNFYIWLDIQQPFEDQLKKLKKALIKLDIYKENLAYIDLRIAGNNGDKIIYKRK